MDIGSSLLRLGIAFLVGLVGMSVMGFSSTFEEKSSDGEIVYLKHHFRTPLYTFIALIISLICVVLFYVGSTISLPRVSLLIFVLRALGLIVAHLFAISLMATILLLSALVIEYNVTERRRNYYYSRGITVIDKRR